ncbi:MAG: hypothetical protein RLZZ142_1440 [Verrucomicrobiota bacterium]
MTDFGNPLVGSASVGADDDFASRQLAVLEAFFQFLKGDLPLAQKEGRGKIASDCDDEGIDWRFESEGRGGQAQGQTRLQGESGTEGEKDERQKEHIHQRQDQEEIQSDFQVAREFHGAGDEACL